MAFATTEAPNSTASWRALPVFLALAFPLSWYPWIIALALEREPTGPNPLGLLVAALIASMVDRGWRGPVGLLAGLVRVSAPGRVWLGALLIVPVALGVTLAIGQMQGLHLAAKPVVWTDLADRFLIALLFVALGEEPAWRGFLQPMLQRQLPPVAATLAVAAIWSVWHVPLMGSEFAWSIVPAFLVTVVAGAFVLAWIANASGGSTLLPMLTHASINTLGAGLVFQFVAPAEIQRFWWLYAEVWAAAAVLLVIATRGRLGS